LRRKFNGSKQYTDTLSIFTNNFYYYIWWGSGTLGIYISLTLFKINDPLNLKKLMEIIPSENADMSNEKGKIHLVPNKLKKMKEYYLIISLA
jgi:hypothetical protein